MSLSKNLKFKSSREVLTKVCCVDGELTATDLDTYVKYGPVDIKDGVYNVETIDVTPTLSGYETTDFPLAPQDNFKTTISLTKEQLKDLLLHASKDETRIFLCGVHVDKNRIVATDGYRLRVIKTEIEANAILPASSLKRLESIMKKGQKVDIHIGDNWFKSEICGYTVFGRLVLRDFPRIDGVLMKVGKGASFTVSKIDYKKIKPLLDKTQRVNFKNENGRVVFSVPNTEYKQDVGMCDNASKIDFDVNLKYFVDGWKDGCEYEFYGENSPIQQTHVGKIIGVVTPLRK